MRVFGDTNVPLFGHVWYLNTAKQRDILVRVSSKTYILITVKMHVLKTPIQTAVIMAFSGCFHKHLKNAVILPTRVFDMLKTAIIMAFS